MTTKRRGDPAWFWLVAWLLFMAQSPQLGAAGGGQSGKLLRWVDENGKVHYSDAVPPEEAERRRIQLNQQGLRVRVYEGSGKADRRLLQLRRRRDLLLAEEFQKDQVLLKTFQSESDIEVSLHDQLGTLDAQVAVLEANILNLEQNLAARESEAGDLERRGQKVPAALVANIQMLRQQILDQRAKRERYALEREQVEAEYAAKRRRFRELQVNHVSSRIPVFRIPRELPEQILAGVYLCADVAACDGLWQHAREFVERRSTTPLDIAGSRILHTVDPQREGDIALTVARIGEPGLAQSFFLELRCHPSKRGEMRCLGQPGQTIREEFPRFLEQRARRGG